MRLNIPSMFAMLLLALIGLPAVAVEVTGTAVAAPGSTAVDPADPAPMRAIAAADRDAAAEDSDADDNGADDNAADDKKAEAKNAEDASEKPHDTDAAKSAKKEPADSAKKDAATSVEAADGNTNGGDRTRN